MQLALADRFLLITPHNLSKHVDFDFSTKSFYFAGISDKRKDSISRITAKSDFIRFQRILEYGGIWMDADTIILRDFYSVIQPLFTDRNLVWHSEQFFGANANNETIRSATSVMLQSERQFYANPGNIKHNLAPQSNQHLTYIPFTYLDPTGDATYRASNWEIPSRSNIRLCDFLRNDQCCVIKVYNSMLSSELLSVFSVEDFLDSDTLLAQIFLKINEDKSFWVDRADALSDMLSPPKS
jgi:hypothetical protein